MRRWLLALASCLFTATIASSQTAPSAPNLGYYTDPQTGITYRKERRIIDKPVVDEKIETREQTTWAPQVVTTVREEARTVYTPSVQYTWQPKWHGWWNPFSQPTLAYHLKPQTTWEARVENVQRPETTTQWVQQKQVVQVPTRTMRIERVEQIVDVPVTVPADRFRPLPANQPNFAPMPSAGQIATRPLGPTRIDASGRESLQTGMPATVLGSAQNPGIIATAPRATVWR